MDKINKSKNTICKKHQLYKFSTDDSCYKCANCNVIFMKDLKGIKYTEYNFDKKD